MHDREDSWSHNPLFSGLEAAKYVMALRFNQQSIDMPKAFWAISGNNISVIVAEVREPSKTYNAFFFFCWGMITSPKLFFLLVHLLWLVFGTVHEWLMYDSPGRLLSPPHSSHQHHWFAISPGVMLDTLRPFFFFFFVHPGTVSFVCCAQPLLSSPTMSLRAVSRRG